MDPCAGGGPQFTATGLGPDVIYTIQVDLDCDVVVTMFPTTEDLALYVVTDCNSPANSCVAVDDGDAVGHLVTGIKDDRLAFIETAEHLRIFVVAMAEFDDRQRRLVLGKPENRPVAAGAEQRA